MLALDPAPVLAESTSQGWASGVSATGTLNLPPTPAVSATGSPAERSLASLPANAIASASVLHVQAGTGFARSAVADLNVAQGQLSASLVTATCKDGAADAKLADLVVGGHRLPAGVAPNTTIAVPPGPVHVTQVVLNKQVPDGHGGITVTAIEASLNVAGVGETVDVSAADCAAASGATAPAPQPAAPAPKPQQGTLPVTG
jgi:hypothetical protein